MIRIGIVVTGLCLVACLGSVGSAQDDAAQAAKDARIVETLLRLRSIDLEARQDLRESVLRYLGTVQGTPRYLEVAEALQISEAVPSLIELAIEQSETPLGIAAGRVVFRLGGDAQLYSAYGEGNEETQVALVRVLGGIGNQATSEWLSSLLTEEGSTRAQRQQAVQGLLGSRRGQETLVGIIEAGQLPAELEVFTAGEVEKANSPELRQRLAANLDLPETADAEPLPPLSELLERRGDVEVGRTVFFGKGTCANCHVVGAEGKEVGPALTEIGAKLSRDAMFVSILDPSAAVSHNFETFVVETIDGEILQGLKVSETDELVTLKLADGQVREIPTEFVDLFQKQELSLMPTGLQKNMTADELVALVEYLSTLKPAGQP